MSSTHQAQRRYNLGSVVMRTDGITHIKTREGWVPEHRHVMMLRLDRDMVPGEKVFHLDNTLRGEEGFNNPKNLTIIKCRTTVWKKLTHSRLIYEPKKEAAKYREFALR